MLIRILKVMTWLPVHVAKFNAPVDCNKDQYFSVWGKIQGPPNESVKVCVCGEREREREGGRQRESKKNLV
jgi:hypothetical protein